VTALATLQREIARAILDGDAPLDAGLAVYRASVFANFASALGVTYPVVRRLVGEAFFAEAARRFAISSPSASGDLGEYGAEFAHFLATYPPAAPLAYLADVARLEWACHECERAADVPPFDFGAFAQVAAAARGRIALTLHPAVRLLRSPHPIAAIHAANAAQRDGTPDRAEGPDFVLVRRVDGHALVAALPRHEWLFLVRLALGDPLEAAARVLPANIAEDFLAAAPARYVAERIVAGFAAP